MRTPKSSLFVYGLFFLLALSGCSKPIQAENPFLLGEIPYITGNRVHVPGTGDAFIEPPSLIITVTGPSSIDVGACTHYTLNWDNALWALGLNNTPVSSLLLARPELYSPESQTNEPEAGKFFQDAQCTIPLNNLFGSIAASQPKSGSVDFYLKANQAGSFWLGAGESQMAIQVNLNPE